MNVNPGRNAPCRCGSGKKYKFCCGRIDASSADARPTRATPPLSPGFDPGRLLGMMQGGHPARAESAVCEALGEHPDAGLLWQLLGLALSMQGKDSTPALQRAVTLLPADAGAHNNLGSALARIGKHAEASACYRRAISIDPRFVEAHTNLARVSMELREFEAAAASHRNALALEADADGYNNLGNCLRALARPSEALAAYRRALALRPDFAEVHNNLGNAQMDIGDLDGAISSYRTAMQLKPDLAEAHSNAGNVSRAVGQLDDAILLYRRALELNPEFSEAHANLGIALRLKGRTCEAEASSRRALALDPAMTEALATLAESHADQGRFAEAEELLQQFIAADPNCPEALAGIVRLRRMTTDDDAWLAAALRIARIPLPPRREVHLRYALGKYFDDTAQFERAFAEFRRANELTQLYRAPHDRAQFARTIDRIIESQCPNSSDPAQIEPSPSKRPVFIVGMLRSGTTLAEQILASHPLVFGAGELSFWNCASTRSGALRSAAQDYLRMLEALSPDALRVIDKMPSNFLCLGLIHAALPHARIIHMRRNPLDTCLSLYFQRFETALSYTNDLEDLAHYYSQYARLMRHWREMLPEEALLEVQYEDLVVDPEASSRKMTDFIGLPWDSACLDFHRMDRTVITASKWQVRQPISPSSVDRWQNYAQFIGPLLPLLENPEVNY